MCQRCCYRKELCPLKGAFSVHLARLDQNSCTNSPGKPHWPLIWVPSKTLAIHTPLSSSAMFDESWKGADGVSSVTCPGAINTGLLLVTLGSVTLITVLLGWRSYKGSHRKKSEQAYNCITNYGILCWLLTNELPGCFLIVTAAVKTLNQFCPIIYKFSWTHSPWSGPVLTSLF